MNLERSRQLAKLVKARDKQCYLNAFRGASEVNGLYVEGYAVGATLPIVVAHGWVELLDGQILEPTHAWQRDGNRYFPARKWSVQEALDACLRSNRMLPLDEAYRLESIPDAYRPAFEAATLAAMGEEIGGRMLEAIFGRRDRLQP